MPSQGASAVPGPEQREAAVSPDGPRDAPVVGEALREFADGAVLFDPSVPWEWTPAWFEPRTWSEEGHLLSRSRAGRGAVAFVRAGDQQWALRHYRRGGVAARFSRDRYVWTGRDRTRSFREWRLLAALRSRGLPVPAPVAAAYWRSGMSYAADLITRRIPDARPLSDRLAAGPLAAHQWRAVGACIRRFHDAGLCHADLNAHNLLLDDAQRPWLLDFDRGRLRRPGSWRQANLARLYRSLKKIAATRPEVGFRPDDWTALMQGYG